MKVRLIVACLLALTLALGGGVGVALASGPQAPTPLAPANGASVTIPFTLSWSAVTDSAGINGYNWEISPSSSMSPVVKLGSTNGATQSSVSGLANGTYFWHVQALDGNLTAGNWSRTQSFVVTGANAAAPDVPVLNQPQGYNTFHPFEVMHWSWSAVPGAATYIVDAATDPSFPVQTEVHADNIPTTSYSAAFADSLQGNFYMRVMAVDANGVIGQPSNLVTFSVSFNNPLPPPPTLLGPPDGATLTLPVSFTWTAMPNPQDSGFILEIADDPNFSNEEFLDNQITPNSKTIVSLTAGTKYWRVNATQGDSSPTLPALTGWSAVRSFVIPSTPPKMGSLAVTNDSVSNGATQTVTVQLTGPAPQGGAVINIASSDPSAAPAPATFTMPAGFAWGQFRFQVGQVTTPATVTLTGSLNATSASVSFGVQPPSLQSFTISPGTITGGGQPTMIVMLSGQAPPGGLAVSLTSDSPAANPPATATVAAGSPSASINLPTSAVTANTLVTISASLNGKALQAQVTLTPQLAPTSLTLNPTVTTSTTGSSGTIRVAAPATSDTLIFLSSSNPSVASVPTTAQVPQGSLTAGFGVFTTPVSAPTTVTISATGAGVTKTATLTINPSGTVTVSISGLTLNPESVSGSSSSTGMVTLSGAAPSGGAVVTLTSSNGSVASAPASVTVAAGATSAAFAVNTSTVAATTNVTISGSFGGATQSATLTVTPAGSVGSTLSALTLSPTSVRGGDSATGTVTLSAPAPAGGVVVTLTSDTRLGSIPSSVTIAAGATSAKFTVKTHSVNATTSVTITATAAGVSRSAALTLTH